MNDDKYRVYDNLNKNISALDTILDEAIRNGNFAKAATNAFISLASAVLSCSII